MRGSGSVAFTSRDLTGRSGIMHEYLLLEAKEKGERQGYPRLLYKLTPQRALIHKCPSRTGEFRLMPRAWQWAQHQVFTCGTALLSLPLCFDSTLIKVTFLLLDDNQDIQFSQRPFKEV